MIGLTHFKLSSVVSKFLMCELTNHCFAAAQGVGQQADFNPLNLSVTSFFREHEVDNIKSSTQKCMHKYTAHLCDVSNFGHILES